MTTKLTCSLFDVAPSDLDVGTQFGAMPLVKTIINTPVKDLFFAIPTKKTTRFWRNIYEAMNLKTGRRYNPRTLLFFSFRKLIVKMQTINHLSERY
jgi:hypothetical protein